MTRAADPGADKVSVLFVCTHNSARSQLAEGLLRARHGERYEAFSAGTVARGVHPLAAEVLREVGIDPGRQSSKTIESLGDRVFDVVVTVCDGAREACPYVPGRLRTIHYAFRDPSAVDGTPTERADAFREVRDEIAVWLDAEFGGAPHPPSEDEWPDVLERIEASGLPTRDLTAAHREHVLVVREGGRVVGSVAVEAHGADGLLRSLAVAPEVRGRGLGSRLVEAAETAARSRGLRSLTLLTTTAAPFFEARGYALQDRAEAPEAVRQSSEFTGTCPSSAVCLGKSLSP